jgi:CYTH domain-containing protein
MNEIERRWLINGHRTNEITEPPTIIQQGYIVSNKEESVRIRYTSKTNKYYLTVKTGSGLVRKETEVEISPEQWKALWPLTEGRRIEKTRFKYRIFTDPETFQSYFAEEDHFYYPKELAGHTQIEIEFDSAIEAHSFKALDYFGKEVTNDGRYTNAELAINGLPKENE